MTDDLAFMTDKANKLAEQLSQHIAAGKNLPLTRKDAEPQRVQQTTAAPAPSAAPKKSASAAESAAAILDSLLAKPRPNEVAAANAVAARGAAALEQIARAIPRESTTPVATAAVATAPVTAPAGPRPRSQAEQELLEVLKAIR
ncbi:MAG: hypothetical protein IT567_03015 [Alphaproteobacteria bacterium]|nr:hypothetical protein [Alphaproteobacteria bacterium]